MSRRIAVILAADLVDYSLMMGEDENATIKLIQQLRETSLEPVAIRNGGEVLKRMGDGWIFAFHSVADAVSAAKEVQVDLANNSRIRMRMGIHMGDIVEDGTDFYGAGVNIASRLQTEAPPGGVMISAELHGLVSGKQAEGFTDAGIFKLKNITRPVEGYQWRPVIGAGTPRANDLPIIAVEPFVAIPNDDTTNLAASDLREHVVHDLSRRTGVRVCDASDGEVEDAVYTLRGRLRATGKRARASLSLLLRVDGSTNWSELYDDVAEDIYSFCDHVAEKAGSDLRLHINSLDNSRIAEILDDNLSVSELRTRGAGLFYECTIPALEQCLSVMERARRLSPDDGMTLSMWVVATSMLIDINFETPDSEIIEELTTASDQAVELLPRSDFVFFARSLFRASVLRDEELAMADAKRCYALNRNYPLARMVLGYGHVLSGDFTRAVSEFSDGTKQSSDPYFAYRVFHKAVAQFCGEYYDDSIATLRDLIDLKPSVRGFRKLLVLALRAAGNEKAAKIEEVKEQTLPDGPNFYVQKPPLPYSHLWLHEVLAPGK
jgi:adenylate cyclase